MIKGFSELVGHTITKIWFVTNEALHYIVDGEHYKQYHYQDCCEYVWLEDVDGDLQALVGSPVTIADETSNHETVDYESMTWTFYRLCTQNASVTMRWCGVSNGYYSESVDWAKVEDDE